MVMLKALTQYQEATGDPRVVPSLRTLLRVSPRARLASGRCSEWAVYRWADELLSACSGCTTAPAIRGCSTLARTLHDQGADWKAHFATSSSRKTTTQKRWARPTAEFSDRAMRAHGVNNAMALKTSARSGRWSPATRPIAMRSHRALDDARSLSRAAERHVQRRRALCRPRSVAGHRAVRGGRGHVLAASRRSRHDRRRRAWRTGSSGSPSTRCPPRSRADMWAHQYDQQAEPGAVHARPAALDQNGPESNIFGLEPNFGCCTANMHQGWPKFVAEPVDGDARRGLAAVVRAERRAASRRRRRGDVDEATDYPFRDMVRFTVTPATSTTFPLMLRIPGWATDTRSRSTVRA